MLPKTFDILMKCSNFAKSGHTGCERERERAIAFKSQSRRCLENWEIERFTIFALVA